MASNLANTKIKMGIIQPCVFRLALDKYSPPKLRTKAENGRKIGKQKTSWIDPKFASQHSHNMLDFCVKSCPNQSTFAYRTTGHKPTCNIALDNRYLLSRYIFISLIFKHAKDSFS